MTLAGHGEVLGQRPAPTVLGRLTRWTIRRKTARMPRCCSQTSSVSKTSPTWCATRTSTNVAGGDQNFFPIYEPDPDALREKYRKAEEESRQVRYDASKEGMSPYSLIFTHTANLCNRLQPTSVKALRLVHNIQSLMNSPRQSSRRLSILPRRHHSSSPTSRAQGTTTRD